MKTCYKCRSPYFKEEKPGFQEVCEECGSYIHCCCNCRFYEEFSRPNCREPSTDAVSDPNGMNHCEYFVFKSSRGLVEDPEDPEMRRQRRRPDWRNVNKDNANKGNVNRGNVNRGRSNYDRPYSGGDSEDRARRARENLNRLFGGK